MTALPSTPEEWLILWDSGLWVHEGICPCCLNLQSEKSAGPGLEGHFLHSCKTCGIVLEFPRHTGYRILRPVPPAPPVWSLLPGSRTDREESMAEFTKGPWKVDATVALGAYGV